jgi:hypothetical protein
MVVMAVATAIFAAVLPERRSEVVLSAITVALFVGLAALYGGMYLAIASREHRAPDLTERISRAAKEMRGVATLVEELETEMAAKMAALQRVQTESADFERVAAVRKEEAEAVTKLVESVISSTHDKMDRANRRGQLLYFALGAATSIPIGVMVNLWTK